MTRFFDPRKPIALDTETSPTKGLLCISYAQHRGKYGAWWGKTDPAFILDVLQDDDAVVVMHNAKYDIRVLCEYFGIGTRDIHCKLNDTMLMAKVLDERWPSYSLKSQGYYRFGDLHEPELKLREWALAHGLPGEMPELDLALVPRLVVHPYTVHDARLTARLFNTLLDEMILEGGSVNRSYEVERSVILPVLQMESNGVLIDRAWVKAHHRRLVIRRMGLLARAKNLVADPSFNIRSTQQVTKVLAAKGIELPTSAKGNVMFNKRARAGVSDPLAQLYEDVVSTGKDLNTYCANFLKATETSPVVHPNFNISEAATRRFSSSGKVGGIRLNWQNIPPEMRRAVIIPKGEVGWFFDYRQIENVIHIFFSDDEERRVAYLADEEWSEYLWLAEKLLGRRITKDDPRYRGIKATKLGMNYGLGWKKFAVMNNIPFQAAYQQYQNIYRACPAIRKLQMDVAGALRVHGFVEDVFGYRYHGYPDTAYKTVAYLIQGCAAGLMKRAITRVNNLTGVKARLTVHDELFVTTPDTPEAPALARKVRHAMTDFTDLFGGLPIRVETYKSTTSWDAKELVKL